MEAEPGESLVVAQGKQAVVIDDERLTAEVGGLLEKNLVVDVKPGENQLTIKVSNSQLKK